MLDQETIQELRTLYAATERQVLFAYHFQGNATDAARKAGYSGNANTLGATGARLIKDTKIRSIIQAITDMQPATILSPEMILIEWTKVINDPMASRPDKAKALDSLAKAHGMFIDKTISLNYNKTDRVDDLTDAELSTLLAQTVSQLVELGKVKPIELIDHDSQDQVDQTG